jgi:hypothetical protein
LAVDGVKCSRILTHPPVNQNCTSNLNPPNFIRERKMKKILLISILLTLLPSISGCMTATYGKNFEQAQSQDQYTLTIYTNAFASQKEATERVNEESKRFMTEKGYKSYNIVSTKSESFPVSKVTFIVQFTR